MHTSVVHSNEHNTYLEPETIISIHASETVSHILLVAEGWRIKRGCP